MEEEEDAARSGEPFLQMTNLQKCCRCCCCFLRLDAQSYQSGVERERNMTMRASPRRDQCRNCETRNKNAWRCMSGETPMSAFRASLLLYDSYWREFPTEATDAIRARSEKKKKRPLLLLRFSSQYMCTALCDGQQRATINWCRTLLTRQEIQ